MSDKSNPYGLPPVPPTPYAGSHAQAPHQAPYQPPYQAPYQAPPQHGYPPPPQSSGYAPPPGPSQGFNPYAPPSSGAQAPQWGQAVPGYALASAGNRLAARLLDGLLMFGVVMVTAIPGAVVESEDLSGGLVSLAALGLVVYQWFLLSTTGQTLGKKWMQVRVVKLDGSPVDFVSAVMLRSWAIYALSFVGSLIVIGGILPLVDVLMIFGDERRCLHDHLAGTRVIQA